MVNKEKGMKKMCKGKGKNYKGFQKPKPKLKPKSKAKSQAKPPNEGICFFCNEPGQWKRNYKLYMDYLKKKNKGSRTTSSGIHVIEINLSTSDSWILDTGSGSHICTNVQGLKGSRSLARGKVNIRVGNGARVAGCRDL